MSDVLVSQSTKLVGIDVVKIQGIALKSADSCTRFNMHHLMWGHVEYLYDKKLYQVYLNPTASCAFFVPDERNYLCPDLMIRRKRMYRGKSKFITEALTEQNIVELTSPLKKEHMRIEGKARHMYRYTREDGQLLWLEYDMGLRLIRPQDCLYYQAKDDITAPVTVWTKGRWQRLIAIMKPMDLRIGDVALYE